MSETCRTCKYWNTENRDKDLTAVCVRFPKQVAGLIPTRHPITGDPSVSPVFVYPEQGHSAPACGEYIPKVSLS